MLNVVIPISRKLEDYFEIIENLRTIERVNLLIGICESDVQKFKNHFADADDVSFHVFQDGTEKEEILNALQSYILGGSIMIMRQPISIVDFYKFSTVRKDVVSCDKKRSKIQSFFFNIWQKILKLFLGVKLYDGDYSVVFLGEEISTVISQSENLSYSSRVDRWRGIEQGTVPIPVKPEKTPVDKKKNLHLLIYAIISILLGALVTTLICVFVKMSIVIGLLVICFDIIAVVVSLIMSIMFAFNCMVGNRRFKKAIEIQIEEVE